MSKTLKFVQKSNEELEIYAQTAYIVLNFNYINNTLIDRDLVILINDKEYTTSNGSLNITNPFEGSVIILSAEGDIFKKQEFELTELPTINITLKIINSTYTF